MAEKTEIIPIFSATAPVSALHAHKKAEEITNSVISSAISYSSHTNMQLIFFKHIVIQSRLSIHGGLTRRILRFG